MTLSVDSDDLATFLGSDVDADRAALLLELATGLAEAIVSPLPDAAKSVVLSAAGRAYLNPASTTAQMAGPYQMSGATGGVYLSKAERASLRRLNGGGGAFSVDLAGVNGAGDATDYPDARFPEVS